jgi:transmembrane sensor
MAEFEHTNASAKALEDESFAWVSRLLSGTMTAEEGEALTAWRAQSPSHESAFAEAVRFQRAVRRAVQAERAAPAATPVSPALRPRVQAPGRVTRRALVGGAIAASAAGYMVVHPPEGLWPSWSDLTADYRTRAGQQTQVAAAPGVEMELNTRTSVSRVAGRSPAIELVSGEAALNVHRDGGAAFAVLASGARTLVSDGALNIRHDRGDGGVVCVTCLQGSAELVHPAGRLQLAAGQQVAYTSNRLDPVRSTDVTLVSAWRKGLLIFRDTPLQQVVDELNRYRPGKIVLVDAALARRPVYGIFQIHQIGGAVKQVQDLTGARAIDLPGGIVLLS